VLGPAVLLAAALATGCATGGGQPPRELEGTIWRIVQVDGLPVERGDDVDLAPHLRVIAADGQVHGATGCNRFSGYYQKNGTRVSFGPIATTRAMCVRPPRQDMEARILDVLNTADGFQLEGRWLWIMVGGQARLTAEVW
jgi:putative lipoprotein